MSAEEALRLPLRKEPARAGMLRLVDIADFDLSACGGTHVDRTGAVGVIAALASERHRGGARLTFVCGGRAVGALRAHRDAIAGSVRVLSVLPHELADAVGRLQVESRTLQKQVKDLQGRLAVHEAAQLVAPTVGGVRVVAHSLSEWDAAGLKAVAAAAIARNRVCAVLLAAGPPLSIVVARSADVPIDAHAVLRQLIDRFGGRGGGKPDLAQGGGLTGSIDAIAAAAQALIESALGSLR